MQGVNAQLPSSEGQRTSPPVRVPSDNLLRHLKIPNSTSASREAGNAYLSLMRGNAGMDETMVQLTELLKEPVWTFDNSDPNLYVRAGKTFWTISLGRASDLSKAFSSMASKFCADGNHEDADVGAVVCLAVANRLLAGNPDVARTVVAGMWGKSAIEIIEACPEIKESSRVQKQLGNFLDMYSFDVAIEWETQIWPLIFDLAPDSELRRSRADFAEAEQIARDLRERAAKLLR